MHNHKDLATTTRWAESQSAVGSQKTDFELACGRKRKNPTLFNNLLGSMPRAPFALIACIALLCVVTGARAGAARSAWLEQVYFEVAEGFVHYGTLQLEGEEVP